MLKEILRQIDSGEADNLAGFAKKLGMDVSAIEGPFRLLVEKGYLEEEDSCAHRGGGGCKSCGGCTECLTGRTGKAYVITGKGRDYLTK